MGSHYITSFITLYTTVAQEIRTCESKINKRQMDIWVLAGDRLAHNTDKQWRGL